MTDFKALATTLRDFNERGGLGPDPVAALYTERRAAFGLFAKNLSDADCEALRPYLFSYGRLPRKAGEPAPRCHDYIDGEWRAPARGEYAPMRSLADDRVTLFHVAASTAEDCRLAVDAADRAWRSLRWAEEGLAYRKWVVKNLSRLFQYFEGECLREIREQIPKTHLEAQKDFWEAKRAADHLEGTAEVALRGELVPPIVPGQVYWRDCYLPAGPAVVVTPMNFIYGIPGIQVVGAYLSGCPFIYKGHPFAAVTNTTLSKLLLASGADPAFFQKVEGFGPGIASLATDPRIAVVSVTGSAETARKIQEGRGLRRVRFEGGGCNWAFVDDGYSDEELGRIAVRLAYSKLGFGSHKCTSLHGVAASRATLAKLVAGIALEMDRWRAEDPRDAAPGDDKLLSPLLVHRAQTMQDLVSAAREAGCQVVREGGRAEGDYGAHSQAMRPALVAGVRPETRVRVDWDGKGKRDFNLATDELFMPLLVAMEMADFDEFVRFSLLVNPHDLATSIYTRDDRKLGRARRVLGGMLKENDGTDSALEWEEFGASTIGESGNMGVGEAQATLSIFCRRQKGRHFVF
ncbi:MAG: aldehyde dehydrogenase family protein [Deltaproteobacteria bacterium]